MQVRAIRVIYTLTALALGGCATSPDYVASQSDYNVCRLSTTPFGGPAARQEIARRNLDCRPYMGAIAAGNATDAAIIQRGTTPAPAPYIPPPTSCTSVVNGRVINTTCQ